MKQHDAYLMNTFTRYPIALVRGQGVTVWDEQGKEYLDFVAGAGSSNLGHCHPRVVQAIQQQAAAIIHVYNLYRIPAQEKLAELLCRASFADRVFFGNSGAEAVEGAIKLARKYACDLHGEKRHVIISMENSFHGRTFGALSATGQPKFHQGIGPLLPGFRFVPFNELDALEKAVDDTVCAILLEPIQGEGGVYCAEEEFLKFVKALCQEKELLLIMDEVQVGMGRTGTLFAHEFYGIEPDVLVLAKALAGGFPIGAILASESVTEHFGPGIHGTTFGGNPLACTVGIATMETLQEEKIIEHCRHVSPVLFDGLRELEKQFSFVKEIRGRGLLGALQLDVPGDPVVRGCIDQGVLVNCVQGNVIRLIPPLIVQESEIQRALETLKSVFSRM